MKNKKPRKKVVRNKTKQKQKDGLPIPRALQFDKNSKQLRVLRVGGSLAL